MEDDEYDINPYVLYDRPLYRAMDLPLENTVHTPENLLLTDLSGVPICLICDRLLEEDQPKCELLCHHTFHTYCMMLNFWRDHAQRCCVCNHNIFPERNDERENIEEIIVQKERAKREAKLKKLEEEIMADKELLKDLKFVKRSITEARKASVALKKVQIVQVRAFKEETETMRQMIKSMQEERIKTMKHSTEAKLYRSKRARAAFYVRVFERKYPGKSLERLRHIPKLKVPGRWELNRILYGYGLRMYYRLRVRI
jgi:hypothetical protein